MNTVRFNTETIFAKSKKTTETLKIVFNTNGYIRYNYIVAKNANFTSIFRRTVEYHI